MFVRFLAACAIRSTLAGMLVALAAPADGQGEPERSSLRIGRPAPESGPTQVSFALYVVDVLEVNDAKELFTADVFVALRWTDPRLAGIATEDANATLSVDDAWSPNVTIINAKSVSSSMEEDLDVDRDGNVLQRRRLVGDFSSTLDLRRFPFDRQTLGLSFVAVGGGPDEVLLVANDELSGARENISPAGWNVEFEGLHSGVERVSGHDRTLSRMDCTLRRNADRRTTCTRCSCP